MSRNQSGAVAQCQLATRFEGIRELLFADPTEARLETHLADWVVPTDRRLPLVFMSWSLRRLLATRFEDLCHTPGVGQKKIESLIQLLHRISESHSFAPRLADLPTHSARLDAAPAAVSESTAVDCSQVSETVWAQWRQRIVEHRLEREMLGRFAPSLQRLSRVIWRTSLGAYTSLTLADLRALKTYGEKRVRSVVEVFGTLQGVLGSAGPQPHLAVRYQPLLISRLEDWTREAIARVGQLGQDEIRVSFIEPLIEQIRIDGGDALADLAQHRLGINTPPESVLKAARRLGFMRARVYQLMNEMATIVAVRWPEGSAIVRRLNDGLCAANSHAPAMVQFEATRDLFFPELRVQPLMSESHEDSPAASNVALPSVAGLFSSDAHDHSVRAQLA